MAAKTTKNIIIHDHCGVAPPDAADVAMEQSLPLTFFDMLWLHFHPIQRLLFYPLSCSTPNFLDNIVPNLKQSLSTALINYLPLAGNFLYPLDDSGMPEIRYLHGDSVSVTIAEYSGEASDFDYLTGNQPREANGFYAFVPDLPEPKIDTKSGFKNFPVLAIKVTLFPGTGICIGFSNHHVIGDASSIVGFIKAWSSISRLGEDKQVLSENNLIPFYDRSVIKDPSRHRANIFWDQMKLYPYGSSSSSFPNNNLRSTFILQKNEIQMLKNSVQARNPGLLHLSSFTVVTSYVWSCIVKSAAKSGEIVDENEPEYFGFAVDARQRTDPPVPKAYFGNCVAFVVVESRHGILIQNDGFFIATELVGNIISEKVNKKDELLREADEWLVKYGHLLTKRIFTVAGSPKFDLYDVDFGWGKPAKYEPVSIDGDGSMSLSKSRDIEGGLEIGMSLPVEKMEAFADVFYDGLKKISKCSLLDI